MTDVEAVLRAYLVTVTALTALVGQRVYASVDLPAGYTPVGNGSALLFGVRGGDQAYSSHQLQPSVQFRCYAETEAKARLVAQALYDALNDQHAAGIKYARMETLPQLLREPEVDWPYCLGFFRVWMDN